jgi:hypothetical protein
VDDTKLQELSYYMVELMVLGSGIGPLLRNAIMTLVWALIQIRYRFQRNVQQNADLMRFAERS